MVILVMAMQEPNETPDAEATVRFREAYLAGDLDRLRELMSPDSYLLAAGAGPLAGRHEGPEGVLAFSQQLRERTAGTLRPCSDDAWDVAVSEYHAFLYQSFAWVSGGEQRSSDEVWMLAFEDGRIARIFQYLEDPHPYSHLE